MFRNRIISGEIGIYSVVVAPRKRRNLLQDERWNDNKPVGIGEPVRRTGKPYNVQWLTCFLKELLPGGWCSGTSLLLLIPKPKAPHPRLFEP